MSTVDISKQRLKEWGQKLPTRSEMPAELSNRNPAPSEFTYKHILKATAPNFFKLCEFVRWDLTIL